MKVRTRREGVSWGVKHPSLPLRAAVILTLGLLLSACQVVPSWKGIIKIAVVAPYSGPATANGQSLLTGARLAVEQINADGGVDGYRIGLIAADELTPSTAEDLAGDPGVKAVIGYLLPDWRQAAPVYQKADLAWLVAEPVGAAVGAYPMVAPPSEVDRALERYLTASAGQPSAAATRAVAACRAAITAGGKMVRAGGIDLLCGEGPVEAAATLTDAPATARLACVAAWCDTPELAEWSGGRTIAYVATVAPATNSAAWKGFDARLGNTAQVPGMAAVGYDGVEIVAEALGRAIDQGDLSRGAIARSMAATDYSGALGAYGAAGPRAPVAALRGDRNGAYPGQLILRVEDASSSRY